MSKQPLTRAQQIHRDIGRRLSEFFEVLYEDYPEEDAHELYKQLYNHLAFNLSSFYNVLHFSCSRPESELIRNANNAIEDSFQAMLRDHDKRCRYPNDCQYRDDLEKLMKNLPRLTKIRSAG